MRPAIVTMTVVLSLVGGAAVRAQSLGQVAAEEAARRKALQRPARVITGDDLKPASPATADVPPFPSDLVTAAEPEGTRVFVAPAKLQGGGVPQIPVMAVNGGEVQLEVTVSAEGAVTAVKELRVTPPFTEALIAAVKGWRFQPAEDAAAPEPGGRIDDTTRRKIPTKVLVLALFRPPSVFQGMTVGTPPSTVAAPSEGVAAPTGALTMPPYPPQALFNGVVLLEIGVKETGAVSGARVVRGAAPFDAIAMQSVRTLGFRPPTVHGKAAPANVYVAVAFRQPVTP